MANRKSPPNQVMLVYAIDHTKAEQVIVTPPGSLLIAVTNSSPVSIGLIARCDAALVDAEGLVRTVLIYRTGENVPNGAAQRYIGSIVADSVLLHVFERRI